MNEQSGPEGPPRNRRLHSNDELLRDVLARVIRSCEAIADGDTYFAEDVLHGLADDLVRALEEAA